jgi:hypothetical protein
MAPQYKPYPFALIFQRVSIFGVSYTKKESEYVRSPSGIGFDVNVQKIPNEIHKSL